jgi:aspartate/methionine/tyrosine aminotransferase
MSNRLSLVSGLLKGQKMFQVKESAAKLESLGIDVVHMELGDPDFDSPSKVISAAKYSLESGETHYGSSWGLQEFRDSININHIKERGFEIKIDQLVVTPGANSGIYFTIRALVNPGEEVLIPNPGFVSFEAAILAAGAKPIRYNLNFKDNFQPSVDEIESLISKSTSLMIINSPSNPTGTVIHDDIYIQISNILNRNNITLLSDDTYCRMKRGYETSKISPLSEADLNLDHSIVLGSLSKEFSMSGFRLGYLAGPVEVIKKINLYIETVNSCVPIFTQRAGIAALEGCKKDLVTNREILLDRADLFIGIINQSQYIDCHYSDIGLYAFPRLICINISADEIAHILLQEHGIACVPGSAFGELSVNHLRFSMNQPKNVLINIADKIVATVNNIYS